MKRGAVSNTELLTLQENALISAQGWPRNLKWICVAVKFVEEPSIYQN